MLKPCPSVFTTPITVMGCQQCLPLNVVQLNSKHHRKTHCHNGIVDTFGKNWGKGQAISEIKEFYHGSYWYEIGMKHHK